MNVTIKLEGNKDSYGFEKITCMEKPIGITLDGFLNGYSNLFYMILKYIQAYYVENYDFEVYDNKHSRIINTKILKEFFDLNLVYEKVTEENIVAWIEEHIDLNHIVFVPVNLKELFYSKYYKKGDWGHINLLYGYERENELFHIIDSVQWYKENTSRYKAFVAEYATMKKMYAAWNEEAVLSPSFIDCNEASNISSVDTILKKFARLYLENFSNNSFKEVSFMSCQFENKANMKKYTEYVLRATSAKEVFFCELISIMKKYNLRLEILEQFEKITSELIQAWEEVEYRVSVKAYREKDKLDFRNELSQIIDMEVTVKKMIVDVCKTILDSEILDSKRDDLIENNLDSIITKVGESMYRFHFNSGKIYPCFGNDDAPKVKLIKQISPDKEYVIQTDIVLCKVQDISQFMAALFMRTVNDELYFWGSCCKKVIRLDLCGVDNNIFEISNNNKHLKIGIKIRQGKEISLFYVNDTGKEIQCYQYEALGNIQEVGLSCKTWGRPEDILIEYEDFKVTIK